MISYFLNKIYKNTYQSTFLFLGYIYSHRIYFMLKNNFYFYFPYFKPLIAVPKTELELFIEKYKNAFFHAINSEKNFNDNIVADFYDKEEYNKIMKEQNNFLEKKWKSSVLIRNTPRGNVIMCYDSFKLGFMYYCDNSLTYDILNSLASYYVIHFSCLDFFIDNTYYKDNKSKFVDLYCKEDNKEKEKEKKKNSVLLENRDVFIKKKPKQVIKKEDETEKNKEVVEKPNEIFRNRFINMGKCVNFSVLNCPPVVNKNNNFQTDWNKKLNSENELQKQVFNYADYKKMLSSQ
tara:strand:- start:101 stop:973 length:873 start_codon:yes stop_codon:yes gene_type:complete